MALLGKLFGGRPTVVLVTFDPEDYSLLFTATTPLPAGQHDVHALVEEHKLDCTVKVQSEEGGLYFGYLLEPSKAARHLAVLLPRPRRETEQRGAERVERVLRASSQALPNYQGTSRDLSTSGVKLQVSGPMAVGDEFECLLEMDDHTMSRLTVNCEVRWCRPHEDHFLVGIRFVDLPKATHSRLAYFVNALTRVEKGVLKGSYEYFG